MSIWNWFGKKRLRSPERDLWNLPTQLLQWSRTDCFTIGNAVEGTLILGATGSGKTSGSGRALARAFLRAGFGGLILTAKADERQLWETYCRECGRMDDLIVFGPGHPHRFNFLDYELTRPGGGAGLTDNIVNLFTTVLEVADRGSGQGKSGQDDGYWRRAMRQLCRNLVDLLALARGSISIPDLYRLVVSAPNSLEQVRSEEWRKSSLCFHCLGEADKRSKTPQQQRDFELVADYFLLEFPALSEKTRSVIVSNFTSTIDVLNRGILRELFCTETTITPRAVEDGKIVLIDLPIKEFAEVGTFAQVLWKYAFQRSIERRNVSASPRPAFLWADEAQNFVTSYDSLFQTTCRSARVATVLLSQNYSNFLAALGGNEKARVETDSLFANLNTKILHANGDAVTNEWAANMIGRSRQFLMNSSNSYPADEWLPGLLTPGQRQNTSGMSESYQYEVQPSVFTTLRTGGKAHRAVVEAILSAAVCRLAEAVGRGRRSSSNSLLRDRSGG